MNTGDFHYALPSELIAQTPLPERAGSRLLHVTQTAGVYRDLCFPDLVDLLDEDDLLVLNDTRVLPARIFGRKATGGKIEVLLERQLEANLALVQLKASRAPAVGGEIVFAGGATAVVDARRDEFFVLRFATPVAEILAAHGHVPLPPYIDRPDEPADRERYQTVFAAQPGAVAAPTAGLHFDRAALERLRAKGVRVETLTLHVGAGTFQPLRDAQLVNRQLHAERFEVGVTLCKAVEATHRRGGRVVAVGTTTARALESAAQFGDGTLRQYTGETTLFITPGYRFQVVDVLLTNFHMPESSLLMLVCAFAGVPAVLDAYAHAVRQRYRFFSYGDAMLCHLRNDAATDGSVPGEAGG